MKGDPSTPLPVLRGNKKQMENAAKEARIDSYLVAKGEAPQPNLLSQEYVMGRAGKQPDRIIDSIGVEYKTLDKTATPNAIRNRIGDSLKEGSQARNFVIDYRDIAPTKQQALDGIAEAFRRNPGRATALYMQGYLARPVADSSRPSPL